MQRGRVQGAGSPVPYELLAFAFAIISSRQCTAMAYDRETRSSRRSSEDENSSVFKLAHNGNSLHVAMIGTYAESSSSWPRLNEGGDAELVVHAINREQAIQAFRLRDPARGQWRDQPELQINN